MNYIDQIRNIDVVRIIEKYVPVKQSGANYKALCPFHNEKTPSLVISQSKNIWKCFGCGAGGDGISFVMDKEGVDFKDACNIIAKQFNIDIPIIEYSEEDTKIYKRQESLKIVIKWASAFFESNLYLKENSFAFDYAKSRWSEETIKTWSIGYAPGVNEWHALENNATKNSIKRDALIDAGLIKISTNDKTNSFDFFRNRLMFPIHDHLGRVVGFTGRSFDKKDNKFKYLNTGETEIFNKGNILFGYHIAVRQIRKNKHAVLVEGNPDVIRMHEIGVDNCVGTQGTSLSQSQISLLKSVCDSVTIIGDGDNAGQLAVLKNSIALLKAGIFVNVIPLPIVVKKEDKIDPDSFFTNKDSYDNFAKDNIISFPVYYANSKKNKSKSDDGLARTMSEIASWLIHLPESIQSLQVASLSKVLGNKSLWNNALKAASNSHKENVKVIESDLSPEQIRSKNKYGFYIDNNCYYFAAKDFDQQGSNFIMKPLFHVQSVLNAKRLYEITNIHGHKETIELSQKDMISLPGFKLRVESLGNFIWEMQEVYFNKLKKFLYDETQTCTEITQLGWQKQNFFAWGNGIFNGSFQHVDQYGIVKHDESNYYLPAFSVIYKSEPTLFQFERKFIHTDSNHISLFEYLIRFRKVFGDNSIIAFSFYLASLFRDIIVNRFGFFPLLNAFGPKGAGKTELAISIMSFFGVSGKGPNINNTSKAALGDHVSQVSNACVHIDEYRNDIEIEKVEFLKGIWDGTGRSRMNMDKDKKKETTAVDAGVILTGQQMPTADIALFSRLIYITFYQTEYSESDRQEFINLKDIEKHGLTHITNDILQNRSFFAKHFSKSYDTVCDDIQPKIKQYNVEDRIFRNWAVCIAAVHCIISRLTVPFNYEEILDIAIKGIVNQAAETRSSNELSTFWNMVQYMDNESLIANKVDYIIKYETMISTDKGKITLPEPIWVIYIHFGRIISLYRKLGRQQGLNILPPDTIKHYLINNSSYMGWKKAMRFMKLDKNGLPIKKDNGQLPIDEDDMSNFATYVTSGYAFKFEELNISLSGFNPDIEETKPF